MNLPLFITLLLVSCCLNSTNIFAATNGVSYKNYRPNNTTRTHVLTVDPSKVKIIAARAQDSGYGLSTVSDLAQHYKALAAVNGGFFRFNQASSSVGLPAGALKLAKHWYGIAYRPRGSIGWDPDTNIVLMDILQTQSKLLINNNIMPINAMNKTASSNKAYLISDSFVEPIIVGNYIGIVFAAGRVDQVLTSGNFSILPGSYAYSADPKVLKKGNTINPGDPVKLEISALPQINVANTKQWNKFPYIIGGGPLLISNKKLISDFKREGLRADFIQDRHARTAVGILQNNHWVLVVVEQDMLQDGSGMTISELQKFMQSLGCVEAVNLDGGGSSAMFADKSVLGATVNFNVSLGRPVADALLVISR